MKSTTIDWNNLFKVSDFDEVSFAPIPSNFSYHTKILRVEDAVIEANRRFREIIESLPLRYFSALHWSFETDEHFKRGSNYKARLICIEELKDED